MALESRTLAFLTHPFSQDLKAIQCICLPKPSVMALAWSIWLWSLQKRYALNALPYGSSHCVWVFYRTDALVMSSCSLKAVLPRHASRVKDAPLEPDSDGF